MLNAADISHYSSVRGVVAIAWRCGCQGSQSDQFESAFPCAEHLGDLSEHVQLWKLRPMRVIINPEFLARVEVGSDAP